MTIIEKFETLLQNRPNINDYNATMEYCADLNTEAVFLERHLVNLEKEYLLHYADLIEKLDESIWKRIKNSSTMQLAYFEGKFDDAKFKELKQGRFLIDQYKTSMFNINTLIANRLK